MPVLVHHQSHRKSLGSGEGETESRPGKYCCVYLPDGTASLALARPGLTIRDMLAGICEKRGLSLPDIKVYLVGNEQVRAWLAPTLASFLTRACSFLLLCPLVLHHQLAPTLFVYLIPTPVSQSAWVPV